MFFIVPVYALFLGLSSGLSSHSAYVSSADTSGSNAERKIALRLDIPREPPLKDQEIRRQIANRVLRIDSEYEPAPGVPLNQKFMGGCPPTEWFYSNGDWKKSVCEVSGRMYTGRWTIESYRAGHWLCVEAVDYAKACRAVWRGPRADQIIMPVSEFTRIGDRIEALSLYRLEATP